MAPPPRHHLFSPKPPIDALDHTNSKPTSQTPRRALADLTNDSPITGLSCFPAAAASKIIIMDCSTNTTTTRFSSPATPGGEDALRSQVKLLLQKVETDIHKAPTLRTLSHINGFLSSPSRLAAPTPVNTPATSGAQTGSPIASIIATPTPRRIPLVNLDDNSLPIYVDLGYLSPQTISKPETGTPSVKWSEKSTETASVCTQQTNSGPPLVTDFDAMDETPLVEAVIDAAEAERQHLGNPITRALQFESPDKCATEITMSSISAAVSSDSSPVRNATDLEDDDISDWSVLVNVSPNGRSPGRLPDESDFAHGDNTERGHLRTTFRLTSSSNEEEGYKLEFLWDQRKDAYGDDEIEYEDCEDRELYLEKEEDDEEYYEEEGFVKIDDCEELCNGLSTLNVKDAKGLPEFQGKHIRFMYNSDDEIDGEEVVSEQVAIEKEALSENVVPLKGLPTPVGKHLRFSEEEDDGSSSSPV